MTESTTPTNTLPEQNKPPIDDPANCTQTEAQKKEAADKLVHEKEHMKP